MLLMSQQARRTPQEAQIGVVMPTETQASIRLLTARSWLWRKQTMQLGLEATWILLDWFSSTMHR
jgi:hypothetical protein